MSNKDKPAAERQFDRYLASYQKLSVFLLIPILLSAFSCVMKAIVANYTLSIAMGYVLFVRQIIGEEAVWTILMGVLPLVVYVPLAFFAAKGKLWCLYVGLGIYAADFVFSFFLATPDVVTRVLQIVLHVLFLAMGCFAVFFYYRAASLLKSVRRQ